MFLVYGLKLGVFGLCFEIWKLIITLAD